MENFSKEKIVEKIRSMNALDIDLSSSYIFRHDPLLYFNALRCFSTWLEALKAAHLSYSQHVQASPSRKWSPFLIMLEIRKHPRNKLRKFYRDNIPLYSAARREFGSWRKALQEAGFRKVELMS